MPNQRHAIEIRWNSGRVDMVLSRKKTKTFKTKGDAEIHVHRLSNQYAKSVPGIRELAVVPWHG